jgi:midasin (ATPase involved in ribosome maturation)
MNHPENGELVWRDGPLAHAVRYGYVVAYEEPFAVAAPMQMACQWLLEADAPKLLLYGNSNINEAYLTPHPEFSIILASNVRGTGDNFDMHAATTTQDSSTLNRLTIRQNLDYMKQEDEVKLLHSLYPDITEVLAGKMVQLANLIRQGWDARQIELPYTPRDLKAFAKYSLEYKDVALAFNLTFFSILNDAEKQTVRQMWKDVDFQCEI